MTLFSSLNSEQREAIGLLQAGTFLEYFDLLLYVHMAVSLNDLFFPKTDPHTAALLSAFAFCSTFIFRPIGALIFGYIGDRIGRKTTVIITSAMMASACIIMANLPTYETIGIAAACIITGCRIIQGMSTLGEIIGAEIYLTETIKPPTQYFAVALLHISADFGSSTALGVASLVTAFGLNWRIAFWIGAIIAMVGFAARVRLRETIEFADMKRRMKKNMLELEKEWIDNVIYMVGFVFRRKLRQTLEFAAAKKRIKHIVEEAEKEKVQIKTRLALFLISCTWPVFFYFIFIYCGNFLKTRFGYTGEQVIHHNFFISLASLISVSLFATLSYKIRPLKLVKFKVMVFIILAILAPLVLHYVATPIYFLLFQSLCIFFAPMDTPATPVLIVQFPVFQRFTSISLNYAFSRALVYIFTSFGLVYITEAFNHWGLWLIMLPILAGFCFGIEHFIKLEDETSFIDNKKKLSVHLKEQNLR